MRILKKLFSKVINKIEFNEKVIAIRNYREDFLNSFENYCMEHVIDEKFKPISTFFKSVDWVKNKSYTLSGDVILVDTKNSSDINNSLLRTKIVIIADSDGNNAVRIYVPIQYPNEIKKLLMTFIRCTYIEKKLKIHRIYERIDYIEIKNKT